MSGRHFSIFALVALTCIVPLEAAERDAVIPIDGCTGFIVEGDLLVTARHCQHPETLTVTIAGQLVTARRVYMPAGVDGPVVFQLEGGPYESISIANQPPAVGDAVYSLGYPGGHWSRSEAQIVGGNGVDVNYTDHRIATGASGGPLLNTDGEVIGVALFVDADIGVHRSGFAGWQATTTAVMQSRNPASATQVIVFSTPTCGPCRQLERDVQAGHFAGYEFQFVRWDPAAQSWSQPELYQQFWQACRPEQSSLAFPTIWVQGSDQFRVGYADEHRGGLLGWLATVVQHLVEGLIGRDEPPTMPPPIPDVPSAPDAELPPDPQELIDNLASDLAAVREQALETRSDFEEFRDAGVVGKIRALARLRTDRDEALEHVAAVRTDVDALRSGLRERPLQFLWGLFGLVSGLVQRRFAH